jgi:hypothetical protein
LKINYSTISENIDTSFADCIPVEVVIEPAIYIVNVFEEKQWFGHEKTF